MNKIWISIDARETCCVLSYMNGGIRTLIARLDYNQPAPNTKRSIGNIDYSLWELDTNQRLDKNYDHFIQVFNWCNWVIEKTFQEKEFYFFIVLPCFLSHDKYQLIEAAAKETGLELRQNHSPSATSLLCEELDIQNTAKVLTLFISDTFSEICCAEIGDRVYEILSKLSCRFDDIDINKRAVTLDYLIRQNMNLAQTDASDCDYIIVTGEQKKFIELKPAIVNTLKRDHNSINFVPDASSYGGAILSGISSGVVDDFLLLEVSNYGLDLNTKKRGSNNIVTEEILSANTSIPVKKELNFSLNESIDSLSFVQTHNYVSKGHLKQSRCLIEKNILNRLDKNYLSKKSREEGSIIITTDMRYDGSFDLNIEDYDSSIYS